MIQITNWSSYQSYKDRKPPWIRLHKSLLDNYDFHKMSANARALLPMLWLLASEDKDPVSGAIRYGYDTIAFRLRLPIKDVRAGVEELSNPNDEGDVFIQLDQSCNETVTEPLRNRTQTVTPETETETETERRGAAVKLYEFYSENIVNAPAKRSDAIHNIVKLLKKGHTKEDLAGAVEDYASHGPYDKPFHPNNFFGQKEYYKGFGKYAK